MLTEKDLRVEQHSQHQQFPTEVLSIHFVVRAGVEKVAVMMVGVISEETITSAQC